MRIAITNVHTSYVDLLAKTGHEFFVFNHPGSPCWDLRQRPFPANVHTIDSVQAVLAIMRKGKSFFDRIILQDTVVQDNQGLPDILDRGVWVDFECPKIMLFHNSFFVNFRNVNPNEWGRIREVLNERLKGMSRVFISDFKKASWGMDGSVILPGIDTEIYGGWRGTVKNALTCLNNATYRDFMNGTSKMSQVVIDYPHTLLGEEQGKGRLASNYEEYRQVLRDCKFYLCLNNPEFEDGYNLSMLEAMATGMPAVTLDHPTSPVKNGVNGFRSDDLMAINKFMHECSLEEAQRLGLNARKTIEDKFNINAFIDNWNEVIENAG